MRCNKSILYTSNFFYSLKILNTQTLNPGPAPLIKDNLSEVVQCSPSSCFTNAGLYISRNFKNSTFYQLLHYKPSSACCAPYGTLALVTPPPRRWLRSLWSGACRASTSPGKVMPPERLRDVHRDLRVAMVLPVLLGFG